MVQKRTSFIEDAIYEVYSLSQTKYLCSNFINKLFSDLFPELFEIISQVTKKKLFLHIGPPKTGSTSIQCMLNQSYHRLLNCGILYPQGGRLQQEENYWVNRSVGRTFLAGPMNSHQLFAWAVMDEVEDLNFDTCWSAILTELKQTQAHSVVISGETFARLPDHKISLLRSLLSDFQVSIIVYLRDPFLRTLSLYTQEVKMGRYFNSFHHFLRDQENRLCFNESILGQWTQHFGIDNLVVRQFEQVLKDSSLEHDFLDILGLDPTEFNLATNTEMNQSPSPAMIRLLSAVNLIEHNLGRPEYLQARFNRIRQRVRRNCIEWKLLNVVIGKLLQRPLFTDQDRSYIQNLTETSYTDLLEKYVHQ